MVNMLRRIQVNIRLEESIIEKVDYLVKKGIFKTRTEAFKKRFSNSRMKEDISIRETFRNDTTRHKTIRNITNENTKNREKET